MRASRELTGRGGVLVPSFELLLGRSGGVWRDPFGVGEWEGEDGVVRERGFAAMAVLAVVVLVTVVVVYALAAA